MLNNYMNLLTECQKNAWLSSNDYDFMDYGYAFKEVNTVEELKDQFQVGWAIRTGFIYKDLAFVQQVNGGDEWLTFKNENGEWKSFESITFGGIIDRGEFDEYLDTLVNNTIDQYWSKVWDVEDTQELSGLDEHNPMDLA